MKLFLAVLVAGAVALKQGSLKDPEAKSRETVQPGLQDVPVWSAQASSSRNEVEQAQNLEVLTESFLSEMFFHPR